MYGLYYQPYILSEFPIKGSLKWAQVDITSLPNGYVLLKPLGLSGPFLYYRTLT